MTHNFDVMLTYNDGFCIITAYLNGYTKDPEKSRFMAFYQTYGQGMNIECYDHLLPGNVGHRILARIY